MIRALYSGASGMIAQQKNVDTIANNIANINTAGFVKSRVLFSDTIYTALTDAENPGSNENLLEGSGVVAGSISRVYTPPVFYETDHPLDLAIEGEGFFVLEGQNGEITYTRNGSFNKAEIDGSIYLVNSEGKFVLDEQMQRITLDESANDININEYGEIEGLDVKIGVMRFTNPAGLLAAGGNSYVRTEASGEPNPVENPKIKQRMLEGSNVSLTEEMTALIRAQRAYQIASNAVRTADEMEALANNMRT